LLSIDLTYIEICCKPPKVSCVKLCQFRESQATAIWNVISMYDDLSDKWEFTSCWGLFQAFLSCSKKLKDLYTLWISDGTLEKIKIKNKGYKQSAI